ncbi:MAG TPA: LacI family DNA-binding transcriptional regulator [Bacteroidota bacterium]|nr:LacI family DNA-binding transcriptional regulator [Bacteroidota bacterium]
MPRKRRTRAKLQRQAVSRVTARDVARALGVSTMTVSRVLNRRPNVDDSTRALVLKTAKKLGYRPNQIAQSLALNRTFTIGVVVPEISHSFFPEAIRGIEEVTYRAGYHLILTHSAETAERERDAIQMLESKRVDGILLSAAQDVQDDTIYRQIMKMGVPLVFFDRCIRGIGASCVSIDDEESARVITHHIIAHGYQRIGHLAGPLHLSVGRERLNGFKRALEESGMHCDESLILESGFQESGGYAAMMKLLDLPESRRPRAVVAINDPAAYGAIKAVLDRGLSVPGDVAVVGFSDDIRAPLMPVPLTTIRQPAYELGKAAAEQLLALVKGRVTSAEDVIVKTSLVLRSSCGCWDDGTYTPPGSSL